MRFGGVNKKLDQLATVIDETMLTSPAPLDALDQPRTEGSLREEVVTALEELKIVATSLMESGTERNKALARRLMVSRQALKLLARTHFDAR